MPDAITRAAALQLAREKWGATAFAERGDGDRHIVGYRTPTPMGWRRVGQDGPTWRAAAINAGLLPDEEGGAHG